jgi:hypothetical protein
VITDGALNVEWINWTLIHTIRKYK